MRKQNPMKKKETKGNTQLPRQKLLNPEDRLAQTVDSRLDAGTGLPKNHWFSALVTHSF